MMNREISIILLLGIFISGNVVAQDPRDFEDVLAIGRHYSDVEWWIENRESMVKLGILSKDDDPIDCEYDVGEIFEMYEVNKDYFLANQKPISWDSLISFKGWQLFIRINSIPKLCILTDDWAKEEARGDCGVITPYVVTDVFTQSEGFMVEIIWADIITNYIRIYSNEEEYFLRTTLLGEEDWINGLIDREAWFMELRGYYN